MSRLSWLPMFIALTACSETAPPPPPPAATAPPTVLDDQLKAMEKAKAVEAELAERKRKMDEKIDGS